MANRNLAEEKAWADASQLFPNCTVAREYRFMKERRFRLDIAIIERKIGIEVEGGLFIGGRHSRGAGIETDMLKYNYLSLLGWKLFRFTPRQIEAGNHLDFLEALKNQ